MGKRPQNRQKKIMENEEMEKEKLTLETLTPETSKTRKRKLLTDPDRLKVDCKVCKETGNPENLIRHGIPIKNLAGVELYGGFSYVYFCSESCRGLFLVNSVSG